MAAGIGRSGSSWRPWKGLGNRGILTTIDDAGDAMANSSISLAQALGFSIDYGKFIGTLWNNYAVLVGVAIGWLITLRSKDLPLDSNARYILLGTYIAASAYFWLVLWQNHQISAHLMLLVDNLAKLETDHPEVFKDIFHRERNICILNFTLYFCLPGFTVCIATLMWHLTKPKLNAAENKQ
ncbi:MAG TPA: hypothetical protein VF601_04280 [Beijerinckiaceae bacterium]|jgi:hypothetical protein